MATPNFPRAKAATASGIKSGFAVPVMRSGDVVGAIEFFSADTVTLSRGRTAALRSIQGVLSSALERVSFSERLQSLSERAAESARPIGATAETMHHANDLIQTKAIVGITDIFAKTQEFHELIGIILKQ